MNGKTVRLGLIGKDVSKSTSNVIHKFILERLGYALEYEKISVDADGFDLAVRRLLGDFDGFNVTIPYKRDILEYLDGLEGDAREYGAVNTVVTATRTGYNTDGLGFMLMLESARMEVRGKKIVVLGAGGAGRSTAVALKNDGADVYIYQRNSEKLVETANGLGLGVATADDGEHGIYGGSFQILVNCTGVGMHEKEGLSPVTEDAFSGAESAIDLIYTPPVTEFMRLAENRGVKTLNGKAMLFYQAYYADCLFLKRTPSSAEAETLYEIYQRGEL